MKIENTKVYGLTDAIIRSGFPKTQEIKFFDDFTAEEYSKKYSTAQKLGSCKPGSGHDCYLKGIIVQADITAPQYWWLQFQRYHFADIISSQSKMHSILKFNLDEQCNKYTSKIVIDILKEHVTHYLEISKKYKDNPTYEQHLQEAFQRIIANTPMGLELTAGITTNYLQLKTIYYQRKNHTLEEWREIFIPWIESLPEFEELVLRKE